MQLELNPTEYGIHVKQLSDLQAFCSYAHGFPLKWFSEKEEARLSALSLQRTILASYSKACPGKTRAYVAIDLLSIKP